MDCDDLPRCCLFLICAPVHASRMHVCADKNTEIFPYLFIEAYSINTRFGKLPRTNRAVPFRPRDHTSTKGITILQWCTEDDAVTKVPRERDVFDIQMHLYTARFVGSRRIRDARAEFMYAHTSVLHANAIQSRRRMNISNKQGLTTAP